MHVCVPVFAYWVITWKVFLVVSNIQKSLNSTIKIERGKGWRSSLLCLFLQGDQNVLFTHHESLNVNQLYLLHLDLNSSSNDVISVILAKKKQNITILLPIVFVGKCENISLLSILPWKEMLIVRLFFFSLTFLLPIFSSHVFLKCNAPPNIINLVQKRFY